MPFLTPDGLGGVIYLTLTLNQNTLPLITGGLLDLIDPENWQVFGSSTVEDMVSAGNSILDSMVVSDTEPGGSSLYYEYFDYSEGTTVTGFSSFTIKKMLVSRIENTVFVNFEFQGVSNAIALDFTLPYPAIEGPMGINLCYVFDNGAAVAGPGFARVLSGGSDVTVRKNTAGNQFTASGVKAAKGILVYVTSEGVPNQ